MTDKPKKPKKPKGVVIKGGKKGVTIVDSAIGKNASIRKGAS